MKAKFTVRYLDSLKPKEARYQILDADVRGLGILVHPSGCKSFFHVRKVMGYPQRTTLGLWPELSLDVARGKASELNSKLATWKVNGYAGTNPTAKPRTAATFLDAVEHFIEHHIKTTAKNPVEREQYSRYLVDSYLAAWKNRSLGSIRREHVRERHEEIAQAHGPVLANRVVQFVSSVFNDALDPDVALCEGTNPAGGRKKFMAVEKSRDRVLQPEEYPAFMAALDKEKNADLVDIIWCALFTGARRGSIMKMRWQDLDFQHGIWNMTERKGRKGIEPLTLPLVPEVVERLKRRPRLDEQWVFSVRPGRPMVFPKVAWYAFFKKTGLENFHFHDLRKSLPTTEGDTGASMEAIRRTLGHESDSIAVRIYERSKRLAETREAMTKGTRRMLEMANLEKHKQF